MSPIRVLVVDDSPLVRQIFVDMLRKEPDVEVVGYARDGDEALLRIAELDPDVVTLDYDMPGLDGLGCLRELMATRPVPVVMVSILNPLGIEATLDALSLGAVDVVCKPDSGSITTLRGIRDEFLGKVRQARYAQVRRELPAPDRSTAAEKTDRVVLVTGSMGGIRSLNHLFEGLPQGFEAPVLAVQHLPSGLVGPLAGRLDALGAMPVREARPGDRVRPGEALFAPYGCHMTVRENGLLQFDYQPVLNGARPAADRLFESGANAFDERCVAVVLSGAGFDGADGAMAIRRAGGTVLVESEATATSFDLPSAVIANGAADRAVPIDAMGRAIAEAVGRDKARRAA
jgi:two-component system chemotaxis response regulator CheB